MQSMKFNNCHLTTNLQLPFVLKKSTKMHQQTQKTHYLLRCRGHTIASTARTVAATTTTTIDGTGGAGGAEGLHDGGGLSHKGVHVGGAVREDHRVALLPDVGVHRDVL